MTEKQEKEKTNIWVLMFGGVFAGFVLGGGMGSFLKGATGVNATIPCIIGGVLLGGVIAYSFRGEKNNGTLSEGNKNSINAQPENGLGSQAKLSSALALTSMILGIVSIVTSGCLGGVLLGVPAIILWFIALSKIKSGAASGRKMAIAGIATGATGFILMVLIFLLCALSGMLLPTLQNARDKARRISCESNLKMIGIALKEYVIDYNNQYPDKPGVAGLEQLRALGYLTDPKVYVCPASTRAPAAYGQPLTEDTVSYIYFGNGMSDIAISPDTPVACHRLSDHKGYGCVLYADGHVKAFTGPDWLTKSGLIGQ